MSNKKGELTTQQIVGLIILIVSFAVILILIFRLNPGVSSVKDICHNSVLLKAKITAIGSPLNCKTSYVCISGGGECDGFEEDYKVNIDLKSGTEKEKKDRVMEAIADEMADCWWMFGEGKIEYAKVFSEYSCGVCSVVKFDKSISNSNSIPQISYNEFYDYLNKAKKDGSQTYFKYIYDSLVVDSSFKDKVKTSSGLDIDGGDLIKTNEKFSIFVGVAWKGLAKDDFIPPYFVQTNNIPTSGFFSSSANQRCKNFDLTKA